MQKRYYDFDTTLSAQSLNNVFSGLVSNVLLSGAELAATANNVVLIAPHVLLLADGIMLEETEQKSLAIPSTINSNYTITYTHQDQNLIGGVVATLGLVSGLYHSSDLPNTTVIGWVKYTSGALDASMLYSAVPGQIKALRTLGENDFAFPGANMLGALSYPVISPPLAPTLAYTDSPIPLGTVIRATNSSGAPTTLKFNQYFIAKADRPTTVTMSLTKANNNTTIAFVVYDTNIVASGTLSDSVILTPTVFTADANNVFIAKSRILTGTFTGGLRYKVEATITIPVAETVQVLNISSGPWDDPFTP